MNDISYSTYLQLKEAIKGYEKTLSEEPLTPAGREKIKQLLQRAKFIAASYEVLTMGGKYILVNGKPKKEPDLIKWANWFETADRTIKKETINGVYISTVFLGLDHNFSGGKPILWETLVQGPGWDEMQRYSSLEAAKKGHEEFAAIILMEAKNATKKHDDHGVNLIADDGKQPSGTEDNQ